MTYTAQKLARDDVQNRLRVDIVPGAAVNFRMEINADDTYDFYGLWKKSLTTIADQISAEVVQSYQVDWAENGAVAVEKFSMSTPGKYAAIFMDMQMPVMDGVEAAKEIRQSPSIFRKL